LAQFGESGEFSRTRGTSLKVALQDHAFGQGELAIVQAAQQILDLLTIHFSGLVQFDVQKPEEYYAQAISAATTEGAIPITAPISL
jgi:hypothetical protein